MTEIEVELGARSYCVRIEDGLVERIGSAIAPQVDGGRIFIVSDEQVWAAQGPRLLDGLAQTGTVPFLVQTGEGSKSWPVLERLIDHLVTQSIERRDLILAFGGGVVGDLAGFAAAIVNRGCAYVQVPTSLLAQVDSAIGGKTGINLSTGKNLVGAFHQPRAVLIDPSCLQTLDQRQLRSGYAEIVKYALIDDAGLFDWLEANGEGVLARCERALARAIESSVRHKIAAVVKDEYEVGDHGRILLNLGHTFAHAIETMSLVPGEVLHGEAVAAGLELAFDLSVTRGLCSAADAARVSRHLRRAGFGPPRVDGRLVAHMTNDKKRDKGRVAFILTRGIGRAFVDRSVGLDEVEAFLDRRAS